MDVFESDREHFRMRATFKLWHVGDHVHYCMFETGDPSTPHVPASSVLVDVGFFGEKTAKETRRRRRTPHEIVHYPMGSTRLCQLMLRLLEALQAQVPCIGDRSDRHQQERDDRGQRVVAHFV